MPRKIVNQREYDELFYGNRVGFNHCLGGISTQKDWPEIVSVGNDLWLFTAKEMEAIKLYKELSLRQDIEYREILRNM